MHRSPVASGSPAGQSCWCLDLVQLSLGLWATFFLMAWPVSRTDQAALNAPYPSNFYMYPARPQGNLTKLDRYLTKCGMKRAPVAHARAL
jgi:hypothetical protein